jgi:hypothetical protein
MNKPVTCPTRISTIAGGLVMLLVAGLFLAACSTSLASNLSTPLPPEYLPTAAALTLAALQLDRATPTPAAQTMAAAAVFATKTVEASPTVVANSPAAPTATSSPESSPTHTLPSATLAPTTAPDIQVSGVVTALFGATSTPAPPIPDARIQIYRLGELSKVISPLDVSARLTCGDGKVVRIELYGEDGRLLARDVRNYKVPWDAARIGMPLDFEISAAAELGRLVISAEDSFGRLIEVNSMNLILLSQGITELNPSSGLAQRIIIQDPPEQTLIQGGKLIISGRARPETAQPLRVMLVGEDGRILGQRLAGVTVLISGDYGTFMAEVPYSVGEVTPALLTVFEEGGTISEISFLTSLKVVLAP